MEGDELTIDMQPYEFKAEFRGKEYAFSMRAISWPEMERIRSNCQIINQSTNTFAFDEEKFSREVLKMAVVAHPETAIKSKEEFLAKLHPAVMKQLVNEAMKYEKEAAELSKKSSGASKTEE